MNHSASLAASSRVSAISDAAPQITWYFKMTGLKKQRNKNHWTLPYVGAAQRYAVDIWLVEDKSSAYFGKYHVICGAHIVHKYQAAGLCSLCQHTPLTYT